MFENAFVVYIDVYHIRNYIYSNKQHLFSSGSRPLIFFSVKEHNTRIRLIGAKCLFSLFNPPPPPPPCTVYTYTYTYYERMVGC